MPTTSAHLLPGAPAAGGRKAASTVAAMQIWSARCFVACMALLLSETDRGRGAYEAGPDYRCLAGMDPPGKVETANSADSRLMIEAAGAGPATRRTGSIPSPNRRILPYMPYQNAPGVSLGEPKRAEC